MTDQNRVCFPINRKYPITISRIGNSRLNELRTYNGTPVSFSCASNAETMMGISSLDNPAAIKMRAVDILRDASFLDSGVLGSRRRDIEIMFKNWGENSIVETQCPGISWIP